MSKLTLMCSYSGDREEPTIRTFPDTSIRQVVYTGGVISVYLNVPSDYQAEIYKAQAVAKLPDLGGTNLDRYRDWIAS